MSITNFFTSKSLLLLAMFLLFSQAFIAQDIKHNKTAYNSPCITGTSIQSYAANNSFTVSLTDPAAPQTFSQAGDNIEAEVDFWAGGITNDFQIKSVRSYIKLYVDHNYLDPNTNVEKIFQPYVYHVAVDLRGFPVAGDNNTVVKFKDTLMIAFMPDSTQAYQDVHMKSYFGFYRIEAQIEEIYDVTAQYYQNGVPFAGGFYTPTDGNATYTITTNANNEEIKDYGPSGQLYDLSAPCDNAACLKLNWKLELGIDYQKFDINMTGAANPSTVYSNTMSGITLNPQITGPTAADNTLTIDWSFNVPEKPNGASYELEWVYVDNYSVNFVNENMIVSLKSSDNCYYDFNENATRILTDKTKYSIPLIYKKGYIVYRVRLVRPDNSLYKTLKYSPWSLTADAGNITSLNGNHRFEITDAHLNDGFNWNYQNSFAEEGKSKAVLSYFDGLLKNRQSITRFSSLPEQLIVTEPYYNHEGAVGLQTLPVPVIKNPATDNRFEFLEGFTNYNNSGPLRAEHFDDKNAPINSINLLNDLDPSTSLAAKYYSPTNSLLANIATSPYLKSIPDAEGFPLIHTKYLPDDNSRVKLQGGAGKELQIGKNHETKFYYSDPEQNELTKYLGLHAGISEYYEKVITKDPNGQWSFSISNNMGKPVMTGLMGEEPAANQNPNLPIVAIDGVPQIPSDNQVTNLLVGRRPSLWEGTKRVFNKTYTNEAIINNYFTYEVEIDPFQPFCDNGANSGVYMNIPIHYEITATDESNITYTIKPSTDIDPVNSDFVGNNPANLQVGIAVTSSSISNAPMGEMNLQYVLSYDQADVHKAVDNLLINPSALNLSFPNDCFKTEEDFLAEQLENIPDACDNVSGDDQSHCAQWEDKMKQQLYPDNVYGKYSQYGNKHTIIVGDRKSLYAIVGWDLPQNYSTISILGYLNWEETYRDDPYFVVNDGICTTASNYLSMTFEEKSNYYDKLIDLGCTPIYRFQQLLTNYLQINPYTSPLLPAALVNVPTAQQLIDNFNDTYASAFLPVHPEFYDYKRRYCDNEAGTDFINQLKAIPDFETAEMLGLSTLDEIIAKDPFNLWRHNIYSSLATPWFGGLNNVYANFPKEKVESMLMYYPSPFLNHATNPATLVSPNMMFIPIDRYAYIKTVCRELPDEFARFKYIDYTRIAASNIFFDYSITPGTLSTEISNLSSTDKDVFIKELLTHYLLNREKLTELLKDVDAGNALTQTTWMDKTQTLPIVEVEVANAGIAGNQIFEDYIDAPALDVLTTNAADNFGNGSPTYESAEYLDVLADPAPSPIITDYALDKNHYEEYAKYIVDQLKNCMDANNHFAIEYPALPATSLLTTIKLALKSRMEQNHSIKNDKLWKGGITPDVVKEILLANGIQLDDLCNPFLIDYQKSPKAMVNYSKCMDATFFEDMEKSLFWNPGVVANQNSPLDIMDRIETNNQATPTQVSTSYTATAGNSFDDIIKQTLGYTGNTINYTWLYAHSATVYVNNNVSYCLPSHLVFNFSNNGKSVICSLTVNTDYLLAGHFINGINQFPPPYEQNIVSNAFFATIFGTVPCLNPANQTNGQFRDIYCTSTNDGQVKFNVKYTNCKSKQVILNPNYLDNHHASLIYFDGTIEGLDIDNRQNECITSVEMKDTFQLGYIPDVINEYGIKGEGHPFYETSVRSYFNYKFRKGNTSDKYLKFMEGCNLTDQYEIPKYYSYLQASGTYSNINNLVNYLKNYLDDELKLINYFQYEIGGTNYLYVDFSDIFYKNENLRKLKNDIIANNANVTINFNKLNSELGGGIPGKSVDFFVDATFNSAAINALSPTTSSVTMKHNNLSAPFVKYHLDLSNYSVDQLATKIDLVREELAAYNGAYIFFSTHQSHLNIDNKQIDKKAYLKWAYNIATPYDYQTVINELKRTTLTTDVYDGGYPVGGVNAGDYNDAGDYISYLNPDNRKLSRLLVENDHVSGTLFIANTPGNTYGLDFMKHIFQASTISDLDNANVLDMNALPANTFDQNSIFYPKFVYQSTLPGFTDFVSTTVSGIPSHNGNYHIKYRKIDEQIYWYKVKETGYSGVPRFYNIYLSIPDYLTQKDLVMFKIVSPSTDIKKIINSEEVKRFSVKFTNPVNGATFTAYGRTDFDLDNSAPLVYENVMLCDDDTYIDSMESCFDALLAIANDNAASQYNNYIEEKRASISAAFENHIKTSVVEKLTLQRIQKKYAITLYKYDRAGNLITTIPPEGVFTIADNFTNLADAQRSTQAYNGYDAATYLPIYKKKSEYTYNSLNQLITQNTPDGNETLFFYDPTGKLVFSQNAKQEPANKYSYTLYDDQNRIIETGQLTENTSIATLVADLKNYTYPSALLNAANQYIRNIVQSMQRKEVVRTFYDAPLYDFATVANGMSAQENLRGRVSAIVNYDGVFPTNTNIENINVALHYSYDLSGNVKILTYDMPSLDYLKQRYKRIDYDYDLYSGKVNLVSYNRGFQDQFYQQYEYDDDNRITKVQTSQDGLLWDRDAQYTYYPHGPLARIALGDLQVQGIDFAYTLQGWLKHINGDAPAALNDIGGDFYNGSAYMKDLLKSSLNYFANDYKPIAPLDNANNVALMNLIPPLSTDRSLYNGNIASSVCIPGYFNSLYTDYWYDQLNRIKEAKYRIPDYASSTIKNYSEYSPNINNYMGGATENDLYRSSYTYSFDGNLKSLQRFGLETDNDNKYDITNGALTPQPQVFKMDDITYHYDPFTAEGNNKLINYSEAIDHTANTTFDNDLQVYTNANAAITQRFEYDNIGNMVTDITNPNALSVITWSLYGKVLQMSMSNNKYMKFKYEPGGNRFMKSVVSPITINNEPGTSHINEYYIREASGNILAIYKQRQDFTYENPLQQVITGLISASGFASSISAIYGSNASFKDALIEGISSENETFTNAQIDHSAGYFLKRDQSIRNALLSNNASLIPDMLSIHRQTLENAVNPTFDFDLLRAILAEGNDSIKNIFICHLADTNSQTEMLNILSAFGYSYTSSTVDRFTTKLKGKFSTMTTSEIQSAFATVYGTSTPSPYFTQTVTRFLSDSLYVYKNYGTALTFGSIKNYLVDKLQAQGNIDTLASYYDNLAIADSLLEVSTTSYERLAVVFDDNSEDFLLNYKTEGGAADVIANALNAIAGMSPTQFALKWSEVSVENALEISLIMNPVLEKEKFFLAEHHLYGSSRLGIKKYWPNQYLFEWDASQTPGWNGTQFANVELASRRPWYSQPYNSLIATNYTEPWGQPNVDRMSSERLLGQKQYELTNHLGNVMAVVLDKVTEAPTNLQANSFPTEVDKRASLSASYDYYPFGMLMPGRYVEDNTMQCTYISKTRYVPTLVELSALPMANQAALAAYTVNNVTTLELQSNSGGNYLNAFKSTGTSGNTEFSINFDAQELNQDVKIVTNVTNLSSADVHVYLYQEEANNQWRLLDEQVVTSTTELEVKGTTENLNNLKLVYSSLNGAFNVMAGKYFVKEMFAVNYMDRICNTDADFKEDYRFGFNGMHKDNEIKNIGNSLDFGARIYDSRLGKFLSLDPLQAKYPNLSPYIFVKNSPIVLLDLDGREWVNGYDVEVSRLGKALMKKPHDKELYNQLLRANLLQKETTRLINEFKSNDINLYNYIDGLQLKQKQEDGTYLNKNVKAVVKYKPESPRNGGGKLYGETSYRNSDEISIYNENPMFTPKSENCEVGMDITIYSSLDKDGTLANEVGDVMYRMEYPDDAEKYGSDTGKSYEEYTEKGSPGDYSFRVEDKYNASKKEAKKNHETKIKNPYPIKK